MENLSVAISVKSEPMDSENETDDRKQQKIGEIKEEVWIKPEIHEDEDQEAASETDSVRVKEESQRKEEEVWIKPEIHEDASRDLVKEVEDQCDASNNEKTGDSISRLPLKKRIEKIILKKNGDEKCDSNNEDKNEKNASEEIDLQADNTQPKVLKAKNKLLNRNMSDSDDQVTIKKQKVNDDQNAGCSKTCAQRLRCGTQSTDSNRRVDSKATERNRLYRERHRDEINQRRREDRRLKQNSSRSIPATAAERNRKYRERNKQKINERRKDSRRLQSNVQRVHTQCNINKDANEQITNSTPNSLQSSVSLLYGTQSTDSNQRVDNKAAERSRLYRERHREEINQQRRDSRLKQNISQSTPATTAERNRKYRERNKQRINERRRDSRRLQRNVQRVHTELETPLMYSYEITKNIEIVTISEEERQKEHLETMKARQHMRHVCENCALGFVLQHAYEVHMKVHAPESGDHECLLCHSRLKTADMLYRHRLRHYRRYRCLLCWTRFKDKDTAACHVMTDHVGQAFQCDHCGRGFKRPQYLKRHVEQYHTKPMSLECAVCLRVFHERGWYRSHIRTHNEEVRLKTVKLPATCNICSRDFKNKTTLKRHLMTHDEDVHCEICFEKCKNRVTLGKHYLKVHNKKYKGATQEICPECERICATRAMLKRHMQRMHSDRTKKYQCDYCQRLYLTKGEVRSHIMWSHMPAAMRGGHACACGRMFRTPSLLKDHEARFHAPEPPPRVHSCDHCGKAFANKQVLNRHKKSHSNEMYPCNECGLLFKTQPYVKVHYQIKHLKMTRAQIKAQRKLNKNKIIQNNIHKSTNWEPPINDKKGSVEKDQDPLLLQDVVDDIQIKLEPVDEIEVPMFQTFADIERE